MYTTILIICTLYALLNLIGGISQLSQQKSPRLNPILLIVGSIGIFAIFFTLDNKLLSLLILIVGFLSIQMGAILNGLYLHDKITLSHQLIRLLILVSVVSGFIPKG